MSASAQEQPGATTETAPSPEGSMPIDGTPRVQEVTVTGSRILRRDLEAASPILTVESQLFNESSTIGVESVLNQLPQFVPSGTQFVTGDIFPTATNTPGISTLNLRGLGTNRTLVLIDGRRGCHGRRHQLQAPQELPGRKPRDAQRCHRGGRWR